MGGCAPGVPPPRSANELGCQANGGARAGRAPPRSANELVPPLRLASPSGESWIRRCNMIDYF